MARPIIGTRNFIDDATLSGGSWQGTLPLANVQDRRLAKIARSSSDATADSQFLATLTAPRLSRAASINAHNISLAGRVRFQAYDDFTFTRAGVAKYHDSQGIVREAASGIVRRGHYVGGVRTTLLEEVRTNLCLQSEDLSTTWVNQRTTDSSDTTVAPDGATTADSLIEDSTASATHYISQSFAKAAFALAYSFSVYLKANTRDRAELWIWGTASTDRVQAEFDLSNGTVTTAVTAVGGFTAGISDIEPLANGWYRCTVTCTTNTDTDLTVAIFLSDGSSVTYNGDGLSSLYVWGAQLEAGKTPSSYIPTTAASVARVVDVFYQEYTPVVQSKTIYLKFIENGTINIINGRLFHIGGSTSSSNTRITCYSQGTNYRMQFDDGTTQATATLAGPPSIGDTVEIRCVINPDGIILIGQSINGDSETTATDTDRPALGGAFAAPRVYINSGGSTQQGVNEFISLKIESGVKTLAEMRALEKGDLHTYAPHDSGWVNPFEVFPSGVLEGGHPAFGTTTLSQEEWDDGYPVDWVIAWDVPAYGRYFLFEIDDTANADTWLDIGRAWVTYGYKPSHGLSVGARFGYQTESKRRVTDGGAAFHNDRPRRRQIDFRLSQFGEDEALVYLHEINRKLGTSVQALFVGDVDATVHMHRWAFLCTLERLNPLTFARSQWNDQGFSLIEEL